MTIRRSAGGAATAGGMDFQHRVTAWVAVRILAEKEVSLPWDLPVTVTLEWLRCETEQPVDDLLVGTSEGGLVFSQIKHTLQLNTSDIFERKGLTTKATNWLNVGVESHSHWNRCMAYDNCQRHPETDAWARSTPAQVPGHVVCHDPCATRSRQLSQPESLVCLLRTYHCTAVSEAV